MGVKRKTESEDTVFGKKSKNPEASGLVEEILKTDVLEIGIIQQLHDFLRDNKDATNIGDVFNNDKIVIKLLVAYTATTSEKDTLIFSILNDFEKCYNVNLSTLQPLVWGPKCVEHYDKLATFGSSLHRIANDEVLTYFDPILVWKTLRFSSSPNQEGIYDLRFILRVLNSIILPGSDVTCRKLIENNCISLLFSCSSHSDKTIRFLGYYLLQRYLSLLNELKKDDFAEKPLIVYLIKFFKQSIEKEGVRVTHMISHFFARVTKLILEPGHPIYSSLMAFLCLKPQIDLNTVPELYKLLFSSSVENYKVEREWILTLIAEGMIDPIDYCALQNRSGFKLLMSFFGSCMVDQPVRKLILIIIKSAVQMCSAAHDLFLRCNLHSWIASVINLPHLTRWERNFLSQIFVMLVENERKLCRKGHGNGKIELVQVKIAAKPVCEALEKLASTEEISKTHLAAIQKVLQEKWKKKKKKSSA